MFIKDIILEGETVRLVPYEAQYMEDYFNFYVSTKDIQAITNAEPNLSKSDFERL